MDMRHGLYDTAGHVLVKHAFCRRAMALDAVRDAGNTRACLGKTDLRCF